MKKYHHLLLFDFLIFIYKYKQSIIMKTEKQKKVKISITISNDLLNSLDDKTTNRSNYIEYALRFYYHTLGEDITKIKL